MAQLAKDPRGWELEDLTAAHFVSRGCYVETGVKERNPDELLELDLVWTDYRKEPQERHPVEVKSGEWGLGEMFKFFGWTKYLGLEPGQFIYKEPCGRIEPATLEHVQSRTGIRLLHVPRPEDAEVHFKKSLGLPDPAREELPEIWQYSFWAQRRLLKSLSEAIRQGICPESAKAAKQYHHLINNAVFFVSDVRDRVAALLSAHFEHQELASSAAYEIETGKVNFPDPPQTETFKRAAYNGQHFPIQACLYLAHRARIYILKAIVDYWLARERGDIKKAFKFGEVLIDLSSGKLTSAMVDGIEDLSAMKSFRLFPVFWQVFVWSWGGFLLKDRLDEEYYGLSRETGVPVAEIPAALGAFDRLFPLPNGWFREPKGDARRVLILTPAAMRGVGAFRRRLRYSVEEYTDLGLDDRTTNRMVQDNNTGARLLDCADGELAN